jgi:formamidopyrimidine-DNA glycosylase
MPELPEVETIRRGLASAILGVKIMNVEVRKEKLVRGDAATFTRELIGLSFTAIRRRGKLLIFALSNGVHFLCMHLKMTGQLIHRSGATVIAGGHSWPKIEALPNRYSYIIFTFADGSQLFFNDMRQFGYAHIVNAAHLRRIVREYGPEPLLPSFTWWRLQEALRGRSVALKAALLNQQVIAGIGNIYADEICFEARIKPVRRVRHVSESDIRALHAACIKVLRGAVRHRGTTFRNYMDSEGRGGGYVRFLKVYGRTGKPCYRCGKTLVATKVAGRGTTYCAFCQR